MLQIQYCCDCTHFECVKEICVTGMILFLHIKLHCLKSICFFFFLLKVHRVIWIFFLFYNEFSLKNRLHHSHMRERLFQYLKELPCQPQVFCTPATFDRQLFCAKFFSHFRFGADDDNKVVIVTSICRLVCVWGAYDLWSSSASNVSDDCLFLGVVSFNDLWSSLKWSIIIIKVILIKVILIKKQ